MGGGRGGEIDGPVIDGPENNDGPEIDGPLTKGTGGRHPAPRVITPHTKMK